MTAGTSFAGFPAEGLALLAELGHGDKAFLDANRRSYEADLARPAKAFVDAIASSLAAEVSAGIVGVAKVGGSLSPINNDRRFQPDAPAYKDHLLFRWWEGPEKKAAPTLFVRLGRDDVGFATGAALVDLDRWRAAVDDERGAELVAALGALGRGRDLDVVGAELKRVPPPYPADHPRADLLRHKGFQARWSEPTPASITSARFVDWCTRRLAACADVHRWLVATVG